MSVNITEVFMVVNKGEKAHVITRRHFDGDLRRHFIGEVKEVDGPTVRIEGFVYIWDSAKNQFVKKPEKRTSIIDLATSGYIVNLIPADVNIDKVVYKLSAQNNLVVTDSKSFSLDINEFGPRR
jgi:hypothetical protein